MADETQEPLTEEEQDVLSEIQSAAFDAEQQAAVNTNMAESFTCIIANLEAIDKGLYSKAGARRLDSMKKKSMKIAQKLIDEVYDYFFDEEEKKKAEEED